MSEATPLTAKDVVTMATALRELDHGEDQVMLVHPDSPLGVEAGMDRLTPEEQAAWDALGAATVNTVNKLIALHDGDK